MVNNSMKENVIEWYNDSEMVTVTLNQKRYINKVKKYAKQHPDECDIVAENDDGSICAHVPLKWIKISRNNRTLTDEERRIAAERLKDARRKKEEK